MKKLLLAGVAFAGIVGGQAYAAAPASPVSGYAELYGASTWGLTDWGSTYDPWLGAGGAARLNWWAMPGVSTQLDVAGQIQCTIYDFYYCGDALHTAIHVALRNPSYLLGAFGGFAATSDYEGYEGLDFSGFGGVEAQAYMGPVTIYGQVGYAKEFAGYYGSGPSSYGSIYNFNYLFGQLEARVFLTPNTEVSLNVGMVNGETFGSTWGPARTYITYGGEVEQKFGSTPFSVFGRLEALNIPSDASYPGTTYTISAGLKIDWNTATLLDRNNNGASLKVMQNLSPFAWLRVGPDY